MWFIRFYFRIFLKFLERGFFFIEMVERMKWKFGVDSSYFGIKRGGFDREGGREGGRKGEKREGGGRKVKRYFEFLGLSMFYSLILYFIFLEL